MGKTNIPFTKFIFIGLAISSIVIVAALIHVGVRAKNTMSVHKNENVLDAGDDKGLNLGIDFAGGSEIRVYVETNTLINIADIRPLFQDGFEVNIGIQEVVLTSPYEITKSNAQTNDTPTAESVDTMNTNTNEEEAARVSAEETVSTNAGTVEGDLPPVFGLDEESGDASNDVAIDDEPFENAERAVNLTKKYVSNNIFLFRVKGGADDIKSGSDTGAMKISDRITNTLARHFGGESIMLLESTEIGGVVSGRNLRISGLLILVSWIGILIYIMFRFEWRYAVAAIIALIHDVVITAGFLSFFNVELTILILSAILTLIGYSVNDTIVLFDRVRENINLGLVKNFKDVLNMSINQTLTRTINTSVSTLLVVLAMFFLGGEVIHDFAYTLLVGFLVGTYSSIFIASAIVTIFMKDKIHAGHANA